MGLTAQDMMIWLRARDETGAAFQSVQQNLGNLKGHASGLMTTLASLGAGISALGVQQAIRGAVDDLGKIGDVATRVNATTDAVQALQHQLKLGGGEASDAERVLQKFAVTAAEVGQAQNYLTKIFQANGVALREKNGQLRSSDALLQEYARLVANAADQQTKLLLAQEAFGKQAGPNMVAVLEDIAARGLQGVIDQGKAAGVVIENDLIKKSQELDRAFKQLEAQGAVSMKKLALEHAPSLLAIFQTLSGVVKDLAYDLQNLKTGNIQDVIGLYLSPAARDAAQRRRYQATGNRWALSAQDQEIFAQGDAYAAAWYTPSNLTNPNSAPSGAQGSGNNRPTRLPPRTDPQNRVGETLRILEAEAQALTLNVAKRLEAEQIEARINAVRRAGKDATEAEKESIRGAVDALYAKKKAFEEMKRAQDGFNDAAKFGGDQLLNVLDAATDRSKNLSQAIDGVTRALIQAVMRAALLGEGPLAGFLGMKGHDGQLGGFLGMFLNRFSPSAAWDASSAMGSIPDANAWSGLLPGRASGGPVSKGRAYMVGERGPEPFIPEENGIILPNGFGGGGVKLEQKVVIHNHSDARVEQRSDEDGNMVISVRAIARDEYASPRMNAINRQKYGQSPAVKARS
jgi:hypothetical protein